MKSDENIMRRCIKLAQQALRNGDNPFGCVITKRDRIVTEARNNTKGRNDVSKHAEIIAMGRAQKLLRTTNLSDYTLYSNCEPCAMCSYVIRELKFGKVVFGIRSPIMGGYSKWRILEDPGLTSLKLFFGKPPKVIAGLLEQEASEVFEKHGRLLKKFQG